MERTSGEFVRRSARILIVDDEEMNVRFLERILEPAGYSDLATTSDPRRVLALYHSFRPDLILLDLRMPHLDGLQVLDLLKPHIPDGSYLPVVVLTSDVSSEARRQVLSRGATDFLTKPFSPADVRLRVKNLLETRFLHLELQHQNRQLEERVRERTKKLMEQSEELEEARIEVLERLARAAEFRDDETGLHTQRVGHTTALVVAALGLPEREVELVRRAAPLHDLGKIGIPDSVLLKSGRLTTEEFEIMKRHTVIGAAILSGSRVPLLRMGRDIALTHHERWNGSGYPHGLKGDGIPLAGRCVAVADVFDALTHDRPYKPRWSPEDAIKAIEQESGRHFDPAVARVFLRLYRDGKLFGPLMAEGAPAATAPAPRRLRLVQAARS